MTDKIKMTREKNASLFADLYIKRSNILDQLDFKSNHELIRGTEFSIEGRILEDFIRLINEAFSELVDKYTYSMAAEEISNELKFSGEEGLSNYWRYIVRNYHIRDFIPKFFSVIDYIAFMINELSFGKLIPDNKNNEPKDVNFTSVKAVLEEPFKNNMGSLSNIDRKKIIEAFNLLFKNITEYGHKVIKKYRDIMTHRYLPGIDSITVSAQRVGSFTRVIQKGKLFSVGIDNINYEFFGTPEFTFKDISQIFKILLHNLYEAIELLFEIEVAKLVFEKRDYNSNYNS